MLECIEIPVQNIEHGDVKFLQAANEAIDDTIEYCEENWVESWGQKKFDRIIAELRLLAKTDKQGFITKYLKISGIYDISDIGSGYLDHLELIGEIKSRTVRFKN